MLLTAIVTYGVVATVAGFGHAQESDVPPTANVEGKYSGLVRVIGVPSDEQTYGKFNDWGHWTGSSWAGHGDLPTGYWVYVAPNWYIWEQSDAAKMPKDVPTDALDRSYFPLRVGDKWTYASGNGDVVFAVVGKAEVADANCFVVERRIGEHKLKFYTSVADDGVRIHRVADDIYRPPYRQFAFPTRASDTWSWKGKIGTHEGKYECRNDGLVDVNTPGVTARGFHVTQDVDESDYTQFTLVKGVGVTSIYSKKADEHDPKSEGPFSWELKKFTRAGHRTGVDQP